jgi:pyrroloquinoline quinone (PQQ) biosynthesis protein C
VNLDAAAVDLRAALEPDTELDAAAFARRARNAIAQAVIAAAFAAEETLAPPVREPPVDELTGRFGPRLAAELASVYVGREGWTSHAIEALEPLHALAAR